MKSRYLLRLAALTFAMLLVWLPDGRAMAQQNAQPPHIVFIAIDDLNDWVGCLGGHPQVQTPHIDRLARQGVLFTNAHVQATYCGPSRMSVMSGRLPSNTGAYGFAPTYDKQPALQDLPSLPAWFAEHGYRTVGGGKIYHQGIQQGDAGGFQVDLGHGGAGPRPKQPLNWDVPIWDYGPFPDRDEQVDNYQMAEAAAAELLKPQDQPLFLAVGFRRPHVPMYAPQKWFDMYPADEVVLPEVPADDLNDLPPAGRELALTDKQIAPTHAEVLERGKWRGFVQAYLACTSFTDQCVGVVFDALERSPHKDNTLVVLWSDHGWHLGEKQHWAKRTLWEETTRVPLIVAGPGIKAGACSRPVMLLDLYPTLCDLSGLPARDKLDGASLKPLLDNPKAEWETPALTTLEVGAHSVRGENWRYIRYADGGEELYDHREDPQERRNLAADPKFRDILAEHRAHLPKREVPSVEKLRASPKQKNR